MRNALLIMLFALASAIALAEGVDDLGPPGEADKAAIAEAVDRLGAPAYAEREAAQRWLWEVGEPALGALREAARSDDAETVMRAGDLIEMIKLGVPAGAEVAVVQQARRLRDGEKPEQVVAIARLAGLGADGRSVLRRLAPTIEDAQVRRRALDALFRDADDDARRKIADGEIDSAFALLRQAAEAGAEPIFADYAALAYQLGRLDAAIERAGSVDLPAPQRSLLRAHLSRAAGEPGKAAALLAEGDAEFWRRALLIEAGDWPALLAKMKRLHPESDALRPVHESRRRLAMVTRLATGALPDDAIPDAASMRPADRGRWAEFLMLNGRPAEALALSDDQPAAARLGRVMAIGTLAEQERVVEAIMADSGWGGESADDAKDPGNALGTSTLLQVARWLVHVGRVEEAGWLVGRVSDEPSRANQALAAGLLRLGFEQRIEPMLASLIDWESDDPLTGELAGAMFGAGAGRARVWANVLGEQALSDAERLSWLRSLVRGEAGADAVDQAIGWFETWWRARKPQRVADVLAAAAVMGEGKGAWAHRTLREAFGDQIPDALQLFRWLAKHEQWRTLRRVELPPFGDALAAASWLRGLALRRTGDAASGEPLMRRAGLLPLGSATRREDLAAALSFTDAAADRVAEDRALIIRTGRPGEYATEVTNMEAAEAAMARGDYAEALRRTERTRLWLARDSVGAMWGGMAQMDQAARRARAMLALQADRLDEAQATGRAMIDAYPHRIQGIIELVLAIEAAGHDQAADTLFSRAFDQLQAGCQRYPRSAALANEAAWLAARCRRSLAAGLKLAERAVALDPTLDPAIDTLAELHFQRGDPEQAIQWIDKAIALNPDQPYYKRQKERFKTGDPASAPPE